MTSPERRLGLVEQVLGEFLKVKPTTLLFNSDRRLTLAAGEVEINLGKAGVITGIYRAGFYSEGDEPGLPGGDNNDSVVTDIRRVVSISILFGGGGLGGAENQSADSSSSQTHPSRLLTE